MSDLTGQTIRGYEIRDIIGEGGYGAVYRAYQTAVDREVAIKVILPHFAGQSEFALRFENEARLIARLEHLHIVPLYDYWRDETGAHLVMRYMRGGSLRQTLKRQGAISLVHTIRLLEQIGDALTTAHQAGIVHRDLKPDNILLDERGNGYLSDFGIAKNLLWDDHLSASGQIIGAPAYLSPEQINSLNVTPQTDIYSLGFLLYEMLTGEHPYSVVSMGLLIKHLQDPVPPLPHKRADLPPELDRVIQRATAKAPVERYPDIPSLVADFREAAHLLPATSIITVSPAGPVSQTRKTPATPEARNRYNMLQNVYSFWIQGVLESSLGGAVLLDLGLRQNVLGTFRESLLSEFSASNQTLPPDTPILDVFDRMNGKLLIIGEPGSGKTTLLLELARDLLRRADQDDHHPIPVVLNLSSWSHKRMPLVEWLVEELNSKYQVPRRTANAWLEHDELLLLLDGLDEVVPAYRNACVEAINVYRQEHGFVDIALCSRTAEYQTITARLNLNGAVSLKPLTDEQVRTYLTSLGPDMNILQVMLDEDETLRDMSRSPLMLNIMALAFQGITNDNLPKLETSEARRKHLFEVYVQRMSGRRGNARLYSEEQAFLYLSWLACRMKEYGQSIFLIERMQPSYLNASQLRRFHWRFYWSNIGVQTLSWGLPGFLTSWILGTPAWWFNIPLLVAGGIWGWVFASRNWRKWSVALFAGLVFGVAFGIRDAGQQGVETGLTQGIGNAIRYALGFVVVAFLARRLGYDRDTITIIDVLHFSVKAVKLPLAFLGAVAAILLILTSVISFHSPISFLALFIAGFIGASVGLFLSGLTSAEVNRSVRPNQGIRNSLRNALFMSFVFLIIPFLMSSIPVALSNSIEMGIGHGLVAAGGSASLGFLLFGGFAVIQHLILRRILHHDGLIAGNYAQFLDYATHLIFLRKVGNGYIFVHRYLLDYFATLKNEHQSSINGN